MRAHESTLFAMAGVGGGGEGGNCSLIFLTYRIVLYDVCLFLSVWLTTKSLVPTSCNCGACWECMKNNEITQDDEEFLYIVDAHCNR
jgi:hypothetical protein